MMEVDSPDLNVDAALVPDLNLNPNSPLIDPVIEDDTNIEEDENDIDDSAFEELLQPPSQEKKKIKTLSNDEYSNIYDMLLQKSDDGKLNYGVLKTVASHFKVSESTVRCIWKRDLGRISEIRRHSNAIKPFLKDENKRSRLQFCISMLDGGNIPHDPISIGMYNIFHIDEKWFYMMKKSENYYLLTDEEDPMRACKSKNFIGKVMFLVAIARPRLDAQGNELFYGKIGVFPFVTHELAERTSFNKAAGTLETKPITSVRKDVIRPYLIEKVLPAIKAKWPREDSSHPIFIQQDNARTHIDKNDDEFCRAAAQDGFDIRLLCQPPNSPDLNVLDLGFFSAIQS
ncbi:hypothetical protein GH714_007196 [Hevea brasiliensis]|uniref:DUF7769 domain-containing protein n=1 Tax=Hevea brasiliensis TaxID=3981 RepID=A0A6A6MCR0_HEVBR|nr:hypothetical protein GH714_007196 [Hevea brasiliensis]